MPHSPSLDLSGSYNFTAAAGIENNTCDMTNDPARAARFTGIPEGIWDWTVRQ